MDVAEKTSFSEQKKQETLQNVFDYDFHSLKRFQTIEKMCVALHQRQG